VSNSGYAKHSLKIPHELWADMLRDGFKAMPPVSATNRALTCLYAKWPPHINTPNAGEDKNGASGSHVVNNTFDVQAFIAKKDTTQ
jgi:hypothetical protein